jgi:RNA polymerase sigma-70 factor (ECF subfamily)
VNETSACSPFLAVQSQIGDNGSYAGFDPFIEAALDMERMRGQGPAWGTADKALLEDLVTRGRAGDLAAMESLYEMFKGPVFGLVYRYAQNRAAAEDLLQDVFLKVFSHMGRVREASTFPGWIFRIALNTAFSHLRQKRVQTAKLVPLGDMEDRIEQTGAEPVEQDLRGPLEDAIQALAPRLRMVFVLHDVQGYKHEEIARKLGCAVGTSKSQLFKARLKVRDHLRARKAV